jgi:DNA repair protein RadD
LVYRYPFRSATLKGYIKRLKASYVAPAEIELGFTDQRGKTYTLDEVLELKEEEWFSRSVALARLCNQHIVDSSLGKLEELRQSGTRHQLIAVACSINHGKEVRSLYRERGYSAEVIHSKQDEEEQEAVFRDLRNGTLDCIIQVQMLGEGFDHPKLSGNSNGRPKRVSVQRKSECVRCHCSIESGDQCIAIPRVSGGFRSDMRYCDDCFQNILKKTYEDLEEIRRL